MIRPTHDALPPGRKNETHECFRCSTNPGANSAVNKVRRDLFNSARLGVYGRFVGCPWRILLPSGQLDACAVPLQWYGAANAQYSHGLFVVMRELSESAQF